MERGKEGLRRLLLQQKEKGGRERLKQGEGFITHIINHLQEKSVYLLGIFAFLVHGVLRTEYSSLIGSLSSRWAFLRFECFHLIILCASIALNPNVAVFCMSRANKMASRKSDGSHSDQMGSVIGDSRVYSGQLQGIHTNAQAPYGHRCRRIQD